MTNKIKTREEWLHAFADKARPVFESHGYTVPENVRLSVGFTSKGARSKRIGECWSDECSKDGVFEIFITPVIGDASRTADILTHELVHAVVGLEERHNKVFRKCATAVGLEGKMTATVAGDAWREWAEPILDEIGPIPHAELTTRSGGQEKQTTRMVKCECARCGFIMRTTAKWVEAAFEGLRCPDSNCDGDLNVG